MSYRILSELYRDSFSRTIKNIENRYSNCHTRYKYVVLILRIFKYKERLSEREKKLRDKYRKYILNLRLEIDRKYGYENILLNNYSKSIKYLENNFNIERRIHIIKRILIFYDNKKLDKMEKILIKKYKKYINIKNWKIIYILKI